MLEYRRKKVVAGCAAALVLSVGPAALAADCNTLGKPNPIYGAGGSAETATIAKVATYFAGLVEHPS